MKTTDLSVVFLRYGALLPPKPAENLAFCKLHTNRREKREIFLQIIVDL